MNSTISSYPTPRAPASSKCCEAGKESEEGGGWTRRRPRRARHTGTPAERRVSACARTQNSELSGAQTVEALSFKLLHSRAAKQNTLLCFSGEQNQI